jgi:hypothetical protein
MRRAVTVSLSTIGFAAALAVPAGAQAAAKRHFIEVESGTRLSSHGSRYEDVYKIKKSPAGVGSAVRDSVLSGDTFPAGGTDQAISYYKDGRLRAAESYTLSAPHVDGVGTITGTGVCTKGSKAHRLETCHYTLAGTYDLRTGITQITLRGTETLATHHKRKPKRH